MKQILNQLFDHETLSADQAREVLIKLSNGFYKPAEIAAFITVYLMRSISPQELSGFRDALMDLCIPVDLQGMNAIDLCGTGGDGKDTFNISTTASIIVAAAGYNVAKHGNYGVSSISGSSNVLEHLGIKLESNPEKLRIQLEKKGIIFMHAPFFHPSLKSVGPIRKELGIKTFFNMLGPLVNPARPNHRMAGVFNLKLSRLYQNLFDKEDQKYCIVFGLDGYDEVSLTSDTKVLTNTEEKVMSPNDFGYSRIDPASIHGGCSVGESAKILINVVAGTATKEQTAVAISNAALAIRTFESEKSIEECCIIARETISNKKALSLLKNLIDE